MTYIKKLTSIFKWNYRVE